MLHTKMCNMHTHNIIHINMCKNVRIYKYVPESLDFTGFFALRLTLRLALRLIFRRKEILLIRKPGTIIKWNLIPQ